MCWAVCESKPLHVKGKSLSWLQVRRSPIAACAGLLQQTDLSCSALAHQQPPANLINMRLGPDLDDQERLHVDVDANTL